MCAADAAETEDAAKEEEEGEAADETATSSAAAASTAAPAAIKQMYSKQHLEYIASSQNQVDILQHLQGDADCLEHCRMILFFGQGSRVAVYGTATENCLQQILN